MAKQDTEIVLNNASLLFNSEELVSLAPEDLSDDEALIVWSMFDAFEKELVKKRKDAFRKHLMFLAESKGIQNDKGSFEYSPPHSDGKIVKQHRKGKAFVDMNAAVDLLKKKKLMNAGAEVTITLDYGEYQTLLGCLEDAMVDVVESRSSGPVVTETRLEALVNLGKISIEELQSISSVNDPTYALKVTKPSVVKNMVKGGKG